MLYKTGAMPLTAESFSNLINKAEYVSMINIYDRNKLEEMKETQEEISVLKSSLEQQQSAWCSLCVWRYNAGNRAGLLRACAALLCFGRHFSAKDVLGTGRMRSGCQRSSTGRYCLLCGSCMNLYRKWSDNSCTQARGCSEDSRCLWESVVQEMLVEF